MPDPLAVVIDIDGTIIGNIVPQVIEWQLVSDYNKGSMRQFKKFLIDILKNYLIRPGLREFMMQTKETHPNVHFFVFTASEHKWAHFLMPCIEAALGINFNKPFFTRNHMMYCKKSGTYKKSLAKILPQMNKYLKSSMKLNNCVLIDNNSTLVAGESSRLILCSTFDYLMYQDPLRYIPIDKVETNLPRIIKTLNQVDNFHSLKHNTSFNKFYAEYYELVSKLMFVNCSRNDGMWSIVNSSFKSYLSGNKVRKEFKDSFVNKLNGQLKK